MSRNFDEDELINGVRIECGLAFAINTVKKLRQEIAEQNLDIEIYARPFANGRENGLRLSLERYQGYYVPSLNQLAPLVWLFCDRHTNYPICLLTTYEHDDSGLYDLHALNEDRLYLDFEHADNIAADKIFDYFQKSATHLIPDLYGENGKAAFDNGLEFVPWTEDAKNCYSKQVADFVCEIAPYGDTFCGTITSKLWGPYTFRYHDDVEELKRIIDTHIINAYYYKRQIPTMFPIETEE